MNTAGVGLSGAMVKLEKTHISATSGVDGSFTLTGKMGIRSIKNGQLIEATPIHFQNGRIEVSLSVAQLISVNIFDAGGKQMFNYTRVYGCGTNIINPSILAAGVYLVKAKIDDKIYSFKMFSMGTFATESKSIIIGDYGGILDKRAKAFARIADVISVIKTGWLDYRDSMRISDTSGIIIKMFPNAGNVTDTDGNVYQSVLIGNQVWTVQNLRTTKYNDGATIPIVTDGTTWTRLTTPGYCFYNNSTDTAYQRKWGALYNWFTVNTGKLAPNGWHIPAKAEWDTLINYLIANGYNWDGTRTGNKIAKSLSAKTDWDDWLSNLSLGAIVNQPGKNNSSGFTALPGGLRLPADGNFYNQSRYASGYWWSATEYNASFAGRCGLQFDLEFIDSDSEYKQSGFSVRLLRDSSH